MIRCVVELPLLARHDSLRPRTAFARRGMHELVIIAGGLSRQSSFTVLKHNPIIRKTQPIPALYAGNRCTNVDISTKNDATTLIANGLT